jgi:colanic acid biosynthesis glycosyl transferase WcaI
MMLADADVGLITQASGTGQFFFPSKLLSLLQAGVPVATVADEDSELARAVADGGFGVNVAPGQAGALAATLARLASDRGALAQLALRTRWVQRFSPGLVLPHYAQALASVIAGTEPATELVEQHEPSGV